jgi:hypothetical protein
MATTFLLAWITLVVGVASLRGATESRWTRLEQYWGQIKAIRIDQCGLRPGLCAGAIILAQRENRDVALAIRPGTWIKRGEVLVLIEELQVGDAIHVQAFAVEGERSLAATTIEITTPR